MARKASESVNTTTDDYVDLAKSMADYFTQLDKMKLKYGPNVVLMYQLGSFYENYGYVNDDGTVVNNTQEIASLINTTFTSKNSNQPISRYNPHMFGIPIKELEKWIVPIIASDYIVVVYSQAPFDKTCRIFDRVYTQATCDSSLLFDNISNDKRSIMSIYLWNIQSIGLSFGASVIDVSTGNIILHELPTGSKLSDVCFELTKLITDFNPAEYNVYTNAPAMISELKLTGNIYNVPINTKYNDKAIRESILAKVYKETQVNIIHRLNLANYQNATSALIIGIEYVYECNPDALSGMSEPKLYDIIDRNSPYKKCMLVGNTAFQLNCLSNDSRKKSLFDIISKHICTSMGKRLLKQSINNPDTNADILNKKYDIVSTLIASPITGWKTSMRMFRDIERLYKTLYSKNQHVTNLLQLANTIEQFNNVTFDRNVVADILDLLSIDTNYDAIQAKSKEIQFVFEKSFYLDVMKRYKSVNIDVFRVGVNVTIDKVRTDNAEYIKQIDDLIKMLNVAHNKDSKKKQEEAVKLKHKSGSCFLDVTKTRWSIIKKHVHNDFLKLLTVTEKKNSVSITTDYIKKYSKNLYSGDVTDIIKSAYNEILQSIAKTYGEDLKIIGKLISTIDMLSGFATIAVANSYVKPIIDTSSENSYFEVNGLRHAIIEKDTPTVFVANDLSMVKSRGMLLYGINGGGKSILLKSVGVMLVMAQIGCFVSAGSLKYKPYSRIITRVEYADDMYNNESTYLLEMRECKFILDYSDNQTLILGDEVCKGTETPAAISVVSAIAAGLANKGSTYIFTTHLHALANMSAVKAIADYLLVKHLSISFQDNQMVYERKLEDGSGPESYGVDICRYLNFSSAFMKTCYATLRELTDTKSSLVDVKKSRYNSSLVVSECSMCGKQSSLETHHLEEQHTAVDGIVVVAGVPIHKNNKANMTVLCKECHDKLHNKKARAVKKQTPNGVIITYVKN